MKSKISHTFILDILSQQKIKTNNLLINMIGWTNQVHQEIQIMEAAVGVLDSQFSNP